MYSIKLQQFEGPLEALLDLIEAKKMDITEIALAEVTEQFLLYLRSLEDVSQRLIASFLVVASRLILIKSRAILPSLALTEEEEEGIEDLKKRLELLSYFRKIERVIQKLSESNHSAFSRDAFSGIEPVFYPPKEANPAYLSKLMGDFLNTVPKIIKLAEEKIMPRFSLEERMNDFISKISHRIEEVFSQLASSGEAKIDVIISFLAILELAKRRVLEVKQEDNFGEIILTKVNE